jgi:DnaJ-class molecular chaperone
MSKTRFPGRSQEHSFDWKKAGRGISETKRMWQEFVMRIYPGAVRCPQCHGCGEFKAGRWLLHYDVCPGCNGSGVVTEARALAVRMLL